MKEAPAPAKKNFHLLTAYLMTFAQDLFCILLCVVKSLLALKQVVLIKLLAFVFEIVLKCSCSKGCLAVSVPTQR